jgi:hypothetical protein
MFTKDISSNDIQIINILISSVLHKPKKAKLILAVEIFIVVFIFIVFCYELFFKLGIFSLQCRVTVIHWRQVYSYPLT